jgi:hypothetical protein
VANRDVTYVPVSSSDSFGERRLSTRKFSTAFVETEEARPEETRPFKDRLQSIHPFGTTRRDREGIKVQGESRLGPDS